MERTDCSYTIEALLDTTEDASDRVMAAVNHGVSDFVLTSYDGSVSAKVRLRLPGLAATNHCFGGREVRVNWAAMTIESGTQRLGLSRTELRLLAALVEAHGRIVARADLVLRVWPDGEMEQAERGNALAVYVHALRRRFATLGISNVLRTARGSGYQLTEP